MPKMWEIWECTPLEFIMRIRFPYEDPELAKMPGLDPSRQTVLPENYAAQAAEYRKALITISERELYVIAEEVEREITEELGQTESRRIIATRETEEASQFYNQPEADADFEAWARTPFWSITEAVALSFGKDPEVVNWRTVQAIETASEFAKQFKARHRIFYRAALAKVLGEAMSPRMFLGWTEWTRFNIPQALVAAIQQFSLGVNVSDQMDETNLPLLAQKEAEIALLLQRIAELEEIMSTKDENPEFLTPSQKAGATKRDNSLMKLIITMAVCGYYYDPNSEYNKVIPEICSDADLLGLKIDVGTVRKYVNLSRQLLPKNFDMSILNNRKTRPKT